MRGRLRSLRCPGHGTIRRRLPRSFLRRFCSLRRRPQHPRRRCPRRRTPRHPLHHRRPHRRRPRRRRPRRRPTRRCRPRHLLLIRRHLRCSSQMRIVTSGWASLRVPNSRWAGCSLVARCLGRLAAGGASGSRDRRRRLSSWWMPPTEPARDLEGDDRRTPRVALEVVPGAGAAAGATTGVLLRSHCLRTGTTAGKPAWLRSSHAGSSAFWSVRGLASCPTCRRATGTRQPLLPTETCG